MVSLSYLPGRCPTKGPRPLASVSWDHCNKVTHTTEGHSLAGVEDGNPKSRRQKDGFLPGCGGACVPGPPSFQSFAGARWRLGSSLQSRPSSASGLLSVYGSVSEFPC